METKSIATDPAVISMAAQLDQLEAALSEAHDHVDKMAGCRAQENKDSQSGARACLERCLAQAHSLNERLMEVSAEVGEL